MGFPNPETQFQPGQSGNPGGRPKGSGIRARIRAAVAEALADDPGRTTADTIVERLLKIATMGDDNVARQAIKDVIEQVDGKVPDRIEVTEVPKGYDVSNSPEDL